MQPGETVVMVAPGHGITYVPPIPGTDPCTFSLENHNPQVVAYSMIVVPRYVVRAATFPWRQFYAEIRKPGGVQRVFQGVFQHFARLQAPEDE
ncbi:MAG: hypothetical protein JSV86_10540 [Gemmatimonadota bacterium]|nr:MAG: hypothetical protein JSV86_10540 [Gemmatimonadota bacterium]